MPSDSFERLGGAAVRGSSRSLPVPQKALNLELLKLGGEAYWGVREDDDCVVVSQLYDPLQDDPNVRFLDSSTVDDDRMLTVPDPVFDHWDAVAGGGTGVEGGDHLEFVTSDELEADSQMLVLPDWQADDLLEDEEA